MQNRREFLKSGLVAVIAGVAGYTGLSYAKDKEVMKEAVKLPSAGLVYSKGNEGKWQGKSGSHAPIVTIKDKKITIKTDHSMSKKHYIVRHTLVTEAGEVIGEKTFSSEDEPTSVFDLPTGKTKLYATSFCNKHDLWVTSV
jgi:superoxide reductase